MKISVMSLVGLLGFAAALTSCSDEEQVMPVGNDGSVTFNLTVPGAIQSRAFGDGTTAQTNVCYYVYDKAAPATPVLKGTVPMNTLKGTLTLQLAKAHTYDVVFLAETADAYTYDEGTRKMTVNYANVATSDESLDAFYAVVPDLAVAGAATKDVKLYRPFAQLNIGTSDKAEYEASTGNTLAQTSVTVKGVYSTFDLMAGDVEGTTTDVTFQLAALPAAGETFPVSVTGKTFTYLSMDYLLVEQTKDLVEVALDVKTSGNTEHMEFSNIPVQRNYRTNIYGALLTSAQTFNVEIIPDFDNAFDNPVIADGVTTDAEGNYVIQAPAGLVWMATQVNTGADNFSGKTVKLGADIDMAGVTYQPCGNVIRYPTTTFCGTFDGDNHTISNLTTSDSGKSGYAAAGLFGSSVGPIRNVTLKNVNVTSTHYAGAICGFSSTNVGFVLDNCHVDGGSIVSVAEDKGDEWDNGDKAGGIIGYTVVGNRITNCSVKNITVKAYRDMGGIVGYSGGATITGNTAENVTIFVDNSHNYKNYTTLAQHDAGEIVGESTNGVDASNSATNVSIREIVAEGVASTPEGNYVLSSAAGLKWLSDRINANSGDKFYAGKTITIDTDINMAGESVAPMNIWVPENTTTIDGCGHTISNLNISSAAAGQYTGALIQSMTGNIKNITFKNVTGDAKGRFSGIVANFYGTMENVHVEDVTLTSTDGRIGALVGVHNGGKLINCSVKNANITGTWSVGGLVGATNEDAVGYENCTVDNVTVTNTHGFGGVYNTMTGVMTGNINKEGIVFENCRILNCGSHDKPIDQSFNAYQWNGTTIAADIDSDGNPL